MSDRGATISIRRTAGKGRLDRRVSLMRGYFRDDRPLYDLS